MTIAEILETMINYYEAAFDPGFDEGGGLDEPDTIRKSNRRAAKATWQTLAEEDTDNESYRLPLGKAFWPLSAEERREIQRLFRSEEMRGLVTGVGGRDDDADVEMADAAYWRKGCSSLGRLRYAVLLRIGSKSNSRQHCLVDLKEAVKPGAPHVLEGMPRDFAKRVAAGASHLSPYLGARIRAVELLGKPIFVRELFPQDLKIEIEQVDRKEVVRMAGYLAAVVGKAHGGRWTSPRERTGGRNCGATDQSPSTHRPGFGGAWLTSLWSIKRAISSTVALSRGRLTRFEPCSSHRRLGISFRGRVLRGAVEHLALVSSDSPSRAEPSLWGDPTS